MVHFGMDKRTGNVMASSYAQYIFLICFLTLVLRGWKRTVEKNGLNVLDVD